MNRIKFFLLITGLLISIEAIYAQQEPQYTQYMYNTMSVNPAYAGTSGTFRAVGLHRAQWLGLEGAPQTQTLGVETALNDQVGLGVNIVNDKLGPSSELYVDGNFSYTIPVGYDNNLSFGLKAGLRLLNVDFTKLNAQQVNDQYLQDFDSKFLPTIGAGIYYHNDTKWYIGLSVPNLLTKKQDIAADLSIGKERLHFYLIGGYVIDLTRDIKFKPAFLGKFVEGAPLSLDLSANLLFNEKFTLGLGYRLGASVSGLAGFQITEDLLIGYAYDYNTSGLNQFTSGSHELMLRYVISKKNRYCSCRFY